MPHQNTAPGTAATSANGISCPNCGTTRAHDPACLLARQADRQRAADLARLAAQGAHSRPLAAPEAAALGAAGRRDRRGLRVRVEPFGPRAVMKIITRGRHVLAVLIDAEHEGACR